MRCVCVGTSGGLVGWGALRSGPRAQGPVRGSALHGAHVWGERVCTERWGVCHMGIAEWPRGGSRFC